MVANHMKTSNGWADRVPAGAAALLVAALLSAAPASAQEREVPCEVPESMVLGAGAGTVTFTRDHASGPARVLDALDTWTKVRWVLRVFAPPLARDEVAVHIYLRDRAAFLADYDDIGRVELVRFFVACASRHGYTVAPAQVARSENDEGREAVPAGRGATPCVGLTIAPRGTTPQATLKGTLSAFAGARALR